MGAHMEWQTLDNFDICEVVEKVENEFEIKIPESDWQKIETVGDLFRCLRHRERQLVEVGHRCHGRTLPQLAQVDGTDGR